MWEVGFVSSCSGNCELVAGTDFFGFTAGIGFLSCLFCWDEQLIASARLRVALVKRVAKPQHVEGRRALLSIKCCR